MATHRDLGPTQLLTAVPDATTRNAGNWTITADQRALNFLVAQAEVYQITVDGPVGFGFSLYRGTRLWNNVAQGWQNNWDPVQPLIVRPGDIVYLFWRAPVTMSPAPTAVLWLRYDVDLPENKSGM
jgi:hypothetical protein